MRKVCGRNLSANGARFNASLGQRPRTPSIRIPPALKARLSESHLQCSGFEIRMPGALAQADFTVAPLALAMPGKELT